MRLESTIVQIGTRTDERTGCLSTPIYQSATFAHPALGQSSFGGYLTDDHTKENTQEVICLNGTADRKTAPPEENPPAKVLARIEEAFANMQHGTITLIIQDSHVVQLEKNEKIRLV